MMQSAYEFIEPFAREVANSGEEYVTASSAFNRRDVIEKALASRSPETESTIQLKRLAALLMLEKLCYTRRCGTLQDLIEFGEGSDGLQEVAERHRELVRFGKKESDFVALGTGYGIPLDKERSLSGHLHSANAYTQLESLASAFRRLCAASFPAR